jgi:oligoendopeptidase F
MTTAADHLKDPELLEAAWDLTPLVNGDEESGFESQLDAAAERADAFAAACAGKVASLDSAGLRAAMQETAEIGDLVEKAAAYAYLGYATDTADPVRGARLQKMQERVTEIQTKLLFFDLEWAALEDDRAEQLLSGEGLEFCAHHLRSARRYRPHLLSEPEERILAEKSLTSSAAWDRLFEEQMAAVKVDMGSGEPISLEIALAGLYESDRELRRSTADAVTAALEPGLRTRAFIFNTLLHDKAVDDRLRAYPTWISSRNLANEATDESVDALVSAVTGRYDLPQRWYRLKGKLLGIDQLADYDRYAPIATEESSYGYGAARDLVLDTYTRFSPEAGAVVTRFFDENWIDAPVRENKRGGAFSAQTSPHVHPYIMLNWTATRRDVMTMAHELGHGLHQWLGQKQGIFHQHTGLTLAETASTFGEQLTFQRLFSEAGSDAERLDLLVHEIDGSMATIFRQISMNRFEDAIHNRRREAGELSVDDLNGIWKETQQPMFGDAVTLGEGYSTWWSYIPHFIGSPGYVYAYAYGELLALSVYNRYREIGPDFVPSYLELLSAGGSRSPEELGAIVGIDLSDPGFWDSGLTLVETAIGEAEELADRL